MHDPSTVAFEIKYPWRSGREFMGRRWRNTLITVWHEDPERDATKRATRADDTCGWSTPPTTPENRDRARKLGQRQYSTIFNKKWATQEGKDYARVCYRPESTYDVIYWSWRAIKHEMKKRRGWQYGKSLSRRELDYIHSLASNPVDNYQFIVSEIDNAEKCGDFYVSLYRAFERFNRPWYKHPRWHFWHWRLQIHPLQRLRRRLFVRCGRCKKPFGWNESPVSHGWGGGGPVYHDKCSAAVLGDAKLASAEPHGHA